MDDMITLSEAELGIFKMLLGYVQESVNSLPADDAAASVQEFLESATHLYDLMASGPVSREQGRAIMDALADTMRKLGLDPEEEVPLSELVQFGTMTEQEARQITDVLDLYKPKEDK